MSSPKKHIPQRTCIACRKVKSKRDLMRIVRTPQQTIEVDETGKMNGRGAYICKQPSCWDKLNKAIISQMLKITVSDQDVLALKEYKSKLV